MNAGAFTWRSALQRHPWTVSYMVAVLAAMLAGRDIWWPGRYVVSYDGATYTGPYTTVTMNAIRAGRLPLLDDWIFGGVAHMGNHATGVLYLPRYLALVMDTATANAWVVQAHLVALALAMVLLGRRLGLSPLAAATAASVAVLSGAVTAKSVQFEQILVLAWLPVVLWSVHRLLEVGSRPAGRVAATAAVTAGMVASGHPQIIIQVGYVVVAFSIGLLIDPARRRLCWRLPLAAVWGAALIAPQVAATLAARSGADLTTGRSMDDLARTPYVLQVRQLFRATFGTVLDRDAAVFSGAFEAILFLGIVAATLAVIGAVVAMGDRTRRGWAIPLAIVAVLAAVWALGSRTPIFRIAHAVVPGFDLGRVPARWLCIVAVLAALFVGVAVDASASLSSQWVRRVGAAAVMVALGIAGPLVAGESGVVIVWVATAALLVAALALPRRRQLAVVVLMSVEMFWLAANAIPGDIARSEPPPPTPTSAIERIVADGGAAMALTPDGGDYGDLIAGLRPNANSWFGVRSIDGYDGGVQVTERWVRLADRFTAEPQREMPLRASLTAPVDPVALARLGVRWMVLDTTRDAAVWLPDWRGPVVDDGRWSLWENPSWFGEAWVWPRATALQNIDDPAGVLGDAAAGMAAGAVILGEGVTCDGACRPERASVERVAPERLVVDVDTTTGGVLTLDRQYLDGWSVTVDGVLGVVEVVDDVALGVRVPPGMHTVVFNYRPGWVAPSMLLAAGAVLLLGLVAAGSLRRRGDAIREVSPGRGGAA